MYRIVLIGLAIVFALSSAAAGDYKRSAGPYAVSTILADWTEVSRDQTLPVKIYLAKDADGPRPVIIFSHGMGGSREGAPYLGNHLASYGYVAIHIQHPGTDISIWKKWPTVQEVDPGPDLYPGRRRILALHRLGLTPADEANSAGVINPKDV